MQKVNPPHLHSHFAKAGFNANGKFAKIKCINAESVRLHAAT
jgi:hypothetical protein